ncbi:hypothetical protein ACET3X_006187 [Alternaria dauci]|uniref:Epidermal growth factor receptor-like transmembrane-juxtamembrane segment domain-containing protein n=1 Tax=Alternaria dauci TaxID=48095 RepID=A0ABR3UHL9_9PLEO
MAAASLSTSYTSSTPTSMAGPFMTAFTPPDHCGNVIKTDCYLSTPYSYCAARLAIEHTPPSTKYSIVWAQRMLVVYPTASASDAIITPLDEPTASPGGSSPQPIPPNKDESGLGTGAIVGIVVGVVGALLLVGAFFFWRRRQQNHRHAPVPKGSPAGEHDALPEFVATNGTRTGPAQMTTSTSNGLFQPQPELRSPR